VSSTSAARTTEEGSIVLEEHFLPPSIPEPDNEPGLFASLHDVEGRRLEQMDACNIERMVLSIRAPGAQGIRDPAEAHRAARATNDYVAEVIGRHPTRFAGFAAIALHDIDSGVEELERCVRQLGFVGAMINGYTNAPDGSAIHCDAPAFIPFWEAAADLGVPVYLHPRRPHPSMLPVYGGYAELWDAPATWAFGADTAVQALRLILSGLFDRLPSTKVILGHMGETLPFGLWRFDNRMRIECAKRLAGSVSDYFAANFVITTSGVYDDLVLDFVVKKLGIERVLFSIDYPFEDPADAVEWLENTTVIDDDQRRRIARLNALDLLWNHPERASSPAGSLSTAQSGERPA
jgi:predicted TIM-barrel fold metal-dependent hydrolase